MSALDIVVLFGTLGTIIGVGLWKERGVKTAEQYLRGGNDAKWWTIGLSIMATQASAITFLSMPGQAFEDGMGFVQFYFGQPIAMVLLAAFIVPIFYRLKVYTAYEYLQSRFDRKTRELTALLFLISRGLAAGVSIYAPAIVLSAVLGWNLQLLNVVLGGVVILYTVTGGTRIVARTQTYQMVIMLTGMIVAAAVIASRLPTHSLHETLSLAGAAGKMKIVDPSLRLDTRYTLWSGLLGGLFVGLAYFGTDQSQVQRYLSGESLKQSRLGLMFNGLVKIPMQCLILAVGVLLFVFYAYQEPPVWFARAQWAATAGHEVIDTKWHEAFTARKAASQAFLADSNVENRKALVVANAAASAVRKEARTLVSAQHGSAQDTDFVFIDFVVREFPRGAIGLLLAVILCASMSAVAAALSSLGTTTVIDFYKPRRGAADDKHYLRAGKLFTAGWGVLAVAFAVFAAHLENLIQAVNILGSIFYGPMLGVFLTGFFLKWVRGTAAFIGTLVAEAVVLAVWLGTDIGFLWYNVIGCFAVMIVATLLSARTPASIAKALEKRPQR
jgi:solute:Na+ symporter, SSS family